MVVCVLVVVGFVCVILGGIDLVGVIVCFVIMWMGVGGIIGCVVELAVVGWIAVVGAVVS